jgi:hypothetical protein
LLNELPRRRRQDVLSRLASLPTARLEALLLDMNVNPADLDDVKEAVLGVESITTPADAIRYSFVRQDIREGRFNTTSLRVLYAALEPETCLAEIKYHSDDLRDAGGPIGSRFYDLLEVDFVGEVIDLRGLEATYPALVSIDKSGYPFCQQLGTAANVMGLDALYAPSARSNGGTCTPVFTEASVTNPVRVRRFRLFWDGHAVAHEPL